MKIILMNRRKIKTIKNINEINPDLINLMLDNRDKKRYPPEGYPKSIEYRNQN